MQQLFTLCLIFKTKFFLSIEFSIIMAAQCLRKSRPFLKIWSCSPGVSGSSSTSGSVPSAVKLCSLTIPLRCVNHLAFTRSNVLKSVRPWRVLYIGSQIRWKKRNATYRGFAHKPKKESVFSKVYVLGLTLGVLFFLFFDG